MTASTSQQPDLKNMALNRRRLKPELKPTAPIFNRSIPQNLSNQTQQHTISSASAAGTTSQSIPPLTQNGIISFTNGDPFQHFDDPCAFLASNDDPKDSQENATGVNGMDWNEFDQALLLLNCTAGKEEKTELLSVNADGNVLVCDASSSTGSALNATGSQQSVVVTYVYKVETKDILSASSFLPEIERKILNQLKEICKTTHDYSVVGIESAPDDVEITTGTCNTESAEADDCYIIDGALTLNLDSSSDTAAAEAAARESIIAAMDNDSLLDSTTMPEVVKVQYIAKTYGRTTSIKCDTSELFMVSGAAAETSQVPVTYVYQVDTANVTSTEASLPVLEENILLELGKMCDLLGMYGVMSIASAPGDIETDNGLCTINATGADNCFIIDGALTIEVVSTFSSSVAENSARTIVKNAMDNDSLLNSTTIQEVKQVRYLNETYEDYMGGFTWKEGGAVIGTGGSGTALEKSHNIGAIVGALLGVLCLVLMLSFLLVRRIRHTKQVQEAEEERLRKHKESLARDMEWDLEHDLDDLVAGIDVASARRQANLSGDPEGHFHLGNHHYTADGVRYFSPNCTLCVAAKASGALDVPERPTEIVEDKNDFDEELSYDLNAAKKFSDFNSHDLGKHHSSMHVRQCKSKTCQGCAEKLNGVVFIQSKQPAPRASKKKSVML